MKETTSILSPHHIQDLRNTAIKGFILGISTTDHEKIKNQAYVLLLRLIHAEAEDAYIPMKEEDISLFIEHLSEPSYTPNQTIFSLLEHIIFRRPNHVVLRQLDIIPFLMKHLQSKDLTIRKYAIESLVALSNNPDNYSWLMQSKKITHIIECLESTDPFIQEQANVFLTNIARDTDQSIDIRTLCLFIPLIENNLVVPADIICFFIKRLYDFFTKDVKNHTAFCKIGGIDYLTKNLSSTHLMIKKLSLLALLNLAKKQTVYTSLSTTPSMMNYLSQCLVINDDLTRNCAILTLEFFAQNESTHSSITTTSNMMNNLSQCLIDQDSLIRYNAISILRFLAQSENTHTSITTTPDMMRGLSQCLIDQDSSIKNIATIVLLNLALNQNTLLFITTTPTMMNSISQCLIDQNSLIRKNTISALLHLAQNQNTYEIITTPNMMMSLSQCFIDQNSSTRRSALSILIDLADNHSTHDTLLERPDILIALTPCLQSEDHLTQQRALRVLIKIANNTNTHDTLLATPDIFTMLPHCLSSQDVDTRKNAIMFILRLVENQNTHTHLTSPDILNTLTQCLASQDGETRDFAGFSLNILSHSILVSGFHTLRHQYFNIDPPYHVLPSASVYFFLLENIFRWLGMFFGMLSVMSLMLIPIFGSAIALGYAAAIPITITYGYVAGAALPLSAICYASARKIGFFVPRPQTDQAPTEAPQETMDTEQSQAEISNTV
ncbi:MAG: hypothetical protein CK424_06290 [Legionella sp.]|nr:MAG: hypothetical protein CK424_06290 [Legionella sp.]